MKTIKDILNEKAREKKYTEKEMVYFARYIFNSIVFSPLVDLHKFKPNIKHLKDWEE